MDDITKMLGGIQPLVGSEWWVDGKRMRVRQQLGDTVELEWRMAEHLPSAHLRLPVSAFHNLEPYRRFLSDEQQHSVAQQLTALDAQMEQLRQQMADLRTRREVYDFLLKWNTRGNDTL